MNNDEILIFPNSNYLWGENDEDSTDLIATQEQLDRLSAFFSDPSADQFEAFRQGISQTLTNDEEVLCITQEVARFAETKRGQSPLHRTPERTRELRLGANLAPKIWDIWNRKPVMALAFGLTVIASFSFGRITQSGIKISNENKIAGNSNRELSISLDNRHNILAPSVISGNLYGETFFRKLKNISEIPQSVIDAFSAKVFGQEYGRTASLNLDLETKVFNWRTRFMSEPSVQWVGSVMDFESPSVLSAKSPAINLNKEINLVKISLSVLSSNSDDAEKRDMITNAIYKKNINSENILYTANKGRFKRGNFSIQAKGTKGDEVVTFSVLSEEIIGEKTVRRIQWKKFILSSEWSDCDIPIFSEGKNTELRPVRLIIYTGRKHNSGDVKISMRNLSNNIDIKFN